MVFQSTFLRERLRVVCAWSGSANVQKSGNNASRRTAEPNRSQLGLPQINSGAVRRYNADGMRLTK